MFRFRAFRRRWFLALFGALFVLYVVYNSLGKVHSPTLGVYESEHTLLRQPFQWQPKYNDVGSESNNTNSCRNSVQGQQFIVDERGYVCERNELTSGGCCDVKSTKSTRYNCSSCKTNGCCMVYEHCVSCCLQPEKKPLLQRILEEGRESVDKLIVAVSDHFELCLAKCRTSSKSVQHENSYRDPRSKHCYGEDLPDLHMVPV